MFSHLFSLSFSLTHLFLLHIMLFFFFFKPYIICHFLSMLHYRVVVDCIAIYFIHFFSLSQWAARFSIRSIKATFCEILKIFTFDSCFAIAIVLSLSLWMLVACNKCDFDFSWWYNIREAFYFIYKHANASENAKASEQKEE